MLNVFYGLDTNVFVEKTEAFMCVENFSQHFVSPWILDICCCSRVLQVSTTKLHTVSFKGWMMKNKGKRKNRWLLNSLPEDKDFVTCFEWIFNLYLPFVGHCALQTQARDCTAWRHSWGQRSWSSLLTHSLNMVWKRIHFNNTLTLKSLIPGIQVQGCFGKQFETMLREAEHCSTASYSLHATA